MTLPSTTQTWEGRQLIGKEAEMKVLAYLLWWGIEAKLIGQETWMPEWIHAKLRFNKNDGPKMIKHFPDIDTGSILIQSKSAPNGEEHPSLTIETDSYDTCLELYESGIQVLIVWLVNGKTLLANWVQNLQIEEPVTPRNESSGSHTPFGKVLKTCLREFKSFKSEIINHGN